MQEIFKKEKTYTKLCKFFENFVLKFFNKFEVYSAFFINFDNFNWGLKLTNAKKCKRKVNGGIIIGNTDFTIKVEKDKV